MHKQAIQSIAYVQNYLSFLFLDYSLSKNINNVYLYGSAVRGELTNDSDIDMFIDCSAEREREVEKIAKVASSHFYLSKDYDKWKRFKFTYPLSIQVGVLSSWQLKTSVASEGILLYSKSTNITALLRNVLFVITLPSDKKKYLRFIRRMYGRKERGYKEHGLLKEIEGKKLSTNVIILPKENQHKVESYLLKEKIDYSFKEVSMEE